MLNKYSTIATVSKKGGGRISIEVRQQMSALVDRLLVKYPLKKDNALAEIVVAQIPVSSRTVRTHIKSRRKKALSCLSDFNFEKELNSYKNLNSLVQEDLWDLYEVEEKSYTKAQILSQILKNKKDLIDALLKLGYKISKEPTEDSNSLFDSIVKGGDSPREKINKMRVQLKSMGITFSNKSTYKSNLQ